MQEAEKQGNLTYWLGVGAEGDKRQSIAELVGYKKSGGDMVRKVEFETVMGSAPTISVQ